MELNTLSAIELSAKIRAGELTVKQALDDAYARIEAQEPKYNCYISLCKEEAYRAAEEVQARIDSGELKDAPLAGVPVGIKDNMCTQGVRTTCASKMLENFIPPYDATAIRKVREAGMVITGKLNMDEFAMGSTTEPSHFGATKNPCDPTRVPGGSSGGAAAAVAAGENLLTLGSDTGGSIRQPASFCGVTGLKPTYGAVSRYGLVAYASSLDQIGPLANSARDCAAAFLAVCGRDEKDATSMDYHKFTLADIESYDLAGKVIGIPSDYLGEGIDPEVKQAILNAARQFEALGARVEEFAMPIVKYAVPTYYIIASAEACSNLSRYDGIKYGYSAPNPANLRDVYFKTRSEGFGMEVKRRIMLGNFVLSSGYYDAYYNKALKAKKLIQQAFFDAFQKYDMLLGPVAPTTALKIGESLSDPLKMYLGDIYTVMINLAGLPSVSLPCGQSSENLPIGMQLIGRPFDEKSILGAAHRYQKDGRAE